MAPLQCLLLGTGTSTGLPLTPCLTLSHSYPEAFTSHVPRPTPPPKGSKAPRGHYDPEGPWPRNIQCACCRSAVDPDVPEGWKNKRGNTSAVIRRKGADGVWKNILVDCGKTFLEQARYWFPRYGVQTIDAVLLTHGHDLREWCIRQRRAIPIYLDRPTYEIVAKSFPYLVDASQASGGGDVPTLVWNIVKDIDTFDVCGVEVKTFPAHHGVYFNDPPKSTSEVTQSAPAATNRRLGPTPLICLSFMFDNKILYMGDVSEVPERTWEALGIKSKRLNGKANGHASTSTEALADLSISKSHKDEVDSPEHLPIFIVDALWPLRTHASHFSLGQAMETALRLKPDITYTIGSTHPTTHFMWEEVCRSFIGQDGKRSDHPDAEISKGLVKRVQSDAILGKKGQLRQNWEAWGGVIEPGFDGLLLEVGDDGQWRDLTNPVHGVTR